MTSLTEPAFHRIADQALNEIALALDARLGETLDVELQEGVLTIDLEDGGRYVVNKHAPNRQIWLSSPRSGAWHFACEGPGETWVSTRDAGVTLGGLLRDEIAAATGVFVDLAI